MIRKRIQFLGMFIAVAVFIQPSCGPLKPAGRHYGDFTAYYNTYYNIKRSFRAAELQTRQNLRYSRSAGQPVPVPIAEYQAIIDGGAKLLEFHASSRWIDDTLLMMGIAYFRMEEFGRSERKFSELITIFPESEHTTIAAMWRAMTYDRQGQPDDAVDAFTAVIPRLKRKSDKAFAHLHLADIQSAREQWSDAAEHYELAAKYSKYRTEQSRSWYALGVARYQQGTFEEAHTAFRRAVGLTRNTELAYDAYVYRSRCAVALEQYAEAERILFDLKQNPQFTSLIDDIDLEIAALAIQTGRTDEGIDLYQNYVNSRENSAAKGQAYLQMGYVYRDILHDLPTAKAKFDSVNGAGAARGTIDSARTAAEGLSQGLIAFERVGSLADSISAAQAERDSLENIDWSNPPVPVLEDTLEIEEDDSVMIGGDEGLLLDEDDSAAAEDSMAMEAGIPDSLGRVEIREVPDSLGIQDPVRAARQGPSPAALLADSLLKAIAAETALARGDTVAADSADAALAPVEEDSLSGPEQQAKRRIAELEHEIEVLQAGLQGVYLRIAEFFRYVLIEPDSAAVYLRHAIDTPSRSDNFWKAALQLAAYLEDRPDTEADETHKLHEDILEIEDLPPGIRNLSRSKLGYPEIQVDIPPEARMLERAEAAYLADLKQDTVIALYEQVIRQDSLTASALTALFALQYIYEYRLQDYEAAQNIAQAIIELHPDSSFIPGLSAKLLPPRSNSIFNMTDEEFAAASERHRQTLTVEPDSTGWPPPMDELRGRRFR